MNKPNNQKPAPFVVFGAGEGDNANKAIIGFKSQVVSGYELHICETEGGHKIGDGGVIQNEDITGEYFTMYFCKRESLRAMIRVLQRLDDMWVDELLGKVNLDKEDPVIQKAIRMLYKNVTPEKALGGEDNVPLDTSGNIDFDALGNLEAFRKSSNKTKPKSKSRGFEFGDD